MAPLLRTLASFSLASVVLASPLTHQLFTRYNASSPCAQVGASVATQTAATPTVPAQLAYECITSIPFNQSAALELVDSMYPYIKWQSSTAWIKDPPAEYVEKVQDPVDIWAGMDNIRGKVRRGEYNNEFEVSYNLLCTLPGSSQRC